MNALSGCEHLAHVPDLTPGNLDLLVVAFQTQGARAVSEKFRISGGVGVVAAHALSNFLKRTVPDLGVLHRQSYGLVARKTKLSHGLSQQFLLVRGMGIMTFQATFIHRLVYRLRLFHPVGKAHMAIQTDFARVLAEQFRPVGHVRGVAPETPPVHDRFVFKFSLDRFCVTLLAQRPRGFRTQVSARVSAVGIVTFKACLLRHRLVGIGARFELVAKKA